MNILLIDDEKSFHDILNILSKKFKFNFYSLYSSNNLEDTLKNQKIDYAFVDLNLKNEQGYELLQKIKDLSPHTKCFIFSSSNVESLYTNNDQYKIIDKHKLVETITDLLKNT